MYIAQGMPRARRAVGASAARNGHRGRVGGVSGQRRRVARSWRPRPRRVSWKAQCGSRAKTCMELEEGELAGPAEEGSIDIAS